MTSRRIIFLDHRTPPKVTSSAPIGSTHNAKMHLILLSEALNLDSGLPRLRVLKKVCRGIFVTG
jgi:hypothetical protein